MGYANRLIEYAHKIGKNTADFTVNDLAAFMKEWMRQPTKQEIAKMTPQQRAEYNKDVANMKKWKEEEAEQKALKAAVEVVHDEETAPEVVAEMGLTQKDVNALVWALEQIFENYDLTDTEQEASLTELHNGLKDLVTV
jgi:hypothetical protein